MPMFLCFFYLFFSGTCFSKQIYVIYLPIAFKITSLALDKLYEFCNHVIAPVPVK